MRIDQNDRWKRQEMRDRKRVAEEKKREANSMTLKEFNESLPKSTLIPKKG